MAALIGGVIVYWYYIIELERSEQYGVVLRKLLTFTWQVLPGLQIGLVEF